MADGFTLEIDADLADLIARRTAKTGMTREDAARWLLEQQLFDPDDYVWLNGDPRDPAPARDPNEPTIAWEDLRPQLEARLEARIAARP